MLKYSFTFKTTNIEERRCRIVGDVCLDISE